MDICAPYILLAQSGFEVYSNDHIKKVYENNTCLQTNSLGFRAYWELRWIRRRTFVRPPAGSPRLESHWECENGLEFPYLHDDWHAWSSVSGWLVHTSVEPCHSPFKSLAAETIASSYGGKLHQQCDALFGLTSTVSPRVPLVSYWAVVSRS